VDGARRAQHGAGDLRADIPDAFANRVRSWAQQFGALRWRRNAAGIDTYYDDGDGVAVAPGAVAAAVAGGAAASEALLLPSTASVKQGGNREFAARFPELGSTF
jgi:hypothetical protein